MARSRGSVTEIPMIAESVMPTAGRPDTADRGVDVLGHQDPAALVITAAWLHILGVHQAGDALHVRADVDPHELTVALAV